MSSDPGCCTREMIDNLKNSLPNYPRLRLPRIIVPRRTEYPGGINPVLVDALDLELETMAVNLRYIICSNSAMTRILESQYPVS